MIADTGIKTQNLIQVARRRRLALPAETRAARQARKNLKPRWERRHVMIDPETRLVVGEITLGERGKWDGLYRWTVAEFSGESPGLSQAKRDAEAALVIVKRQMRLPFSTSAADGPLHRTPGGSS